MAICGKIANYSRPCRLGVRPLGQYFQLRSARCLQCQQGEGAGNIGGRTIGPAELDPGLEWAAQPGQFTGDPQVQPVGILNGDVALECGGGHTQDNFWWQNDSLM